MNNNTNLTNLTTHLPPMEFPGYVATAVPANHPATYDPATNPFQRSMAQGNGHPVVYGNGYPTYAPAPYYPGNYTQAYGNGYYPAPAYPYPVAPQGYYNYNTPAAYYPPYAPAPVAEVGPAVPPLKNRLVEVATQGMQELDIQENSENLKQAGKEKLESQLEEARKLLQKGETELVEVESILEIIYQNTKSLSLTQNAAKELNDELLLPSQLKQTELVDAIAKQKNKIEKLEAELASLNSPEIIEISEAKEISEVENKQAQLKAYEEKLAQKVQLLEKGEAEYKELLNQIDSIEKDARDGKLTMGQADLKMEPLQYQACNLQLSIDQLKNKIENLQARAKKMEDSLSEVL